MQAIILAGGKGRRLHPYTTVLPKPLMPIGDYPILEVILRQLGKCGFDDIIISTGYLGELIHAYLQGRNRPETPVRFSHESEPLGTIGPLHLIPDLEDTFLVMNGDILTDLNYRKLLDYHWERKALATIATYQRDTKIDFGVLERDGQNKICGFREKPVYHFDVSMGIYVFQREMLEFVPKDTPFGFDDLMYALTARGEPVYSYPHDGYWLDVGRPDDYERAVEEFEKNPGKFLE
ncbi:nucleoside-diphosphate-sugar pyrophosphorylase [Methanoculleus taiwanensis]|uniref:Nucleoside-diphosphate-sugar pyrophosphorylase n=1 Tax=Methanoculleus taiwanensis TaxID=1550565 RepID=A0A498GY83_9EURY|nr:sugar phosphate nucleotidyltransferase [Methanoculleus taiwanensis]RXE55094.1 nucleoside-diphosphate-sugar pyrophosphorylase [Methanoculleus taiwanensis]